VGGGKKKDLSGWGPAPTKNATAEGAVIGGEKQKKEGGAGSWRNMKKKGCWSGNVKDYNGEVAWRRGEKCSHRPFSRRGNTIVNGGLPGGTLSMNLRPTSRLRKEKMAPVEYVEKHLPYGAASGVKKKKTLGKGSFSRKQREIGRGRKVAKNNRGVLPFNGLPGSCLKDRKGKNPRPLFIVPRRAGGNL